MRALVVEAILEKYPDAKIPEPLPGPTEAQKAEAAAQAEALRRGMFDGPPAARHVQLPDVDAIDQNVGAADQMAPERSPLLANRPM